MTSKYELIESFNSDKQSFLLLGDSILKNDAYVSDGKSVENLLVERTNGKTTCLAVDHSKIVDIYSQVDKIPDNLNSNLTTVFLSAGGNDILTHYVDQGNDSTDSSILGTMFAAYKKLIKSIQKKLPNANIVLLDIYYPDNMTYKQYHSIINEWNQMVYKYAAKNGISVLKISGVLTKPDDFSFGMEPSALGSRKLVDAILSSY
jgi:lysophospholipase L1-like esterase